VWVHLDPNSTTGASVSCLCVSFMPALCVCVCVSSCQPCVCVHVFHASPVCVCVSSCQPCVCVCACLSCQPCVCVCVSSCQPCVCVCVCLSCQPCVCVHVFRVRVFACIPHVCAFGAVSCSHRPLLTVVPAGTTDSVPPVRIPDKRVLL
jgi:hypothetical protein